MSTPVDRLDTHQPDREPVTGGLASPRTLAIMAAFIALSVVGALIKIPSPTGTVALDSAPGFFVAAALGGVPGAIVAAIGHLVTAGTAGFPLTLPVHLGIAAGMALCAWAMGLLARRGGLVWLLLGAVAAIVLNTFVVALVVVPLAGWPGYVGMLLPLLVGSTINVAVALLAYLGLRNTPLIR